MVRTSDVILILVNIIFPPATAAFLTGCSCDLLINIGLTLLGVLPGHVHGFYKNAQAEERYGAGQYKYTGNGEYAPLHGGPHAHVVQSGGSAPPAYGATQ